MTDNPYLKGKVPARYIAETPIVLASMGRPYFDADGKPLESLALRTGDEIRIEGIPGGEERAPLDYIAARVKTLGVTNIIGNVQCYGCCFYNLSSIDANNHDSSNQGMYNTNAAAGFMAASGHGDEALKIARKNEAVLPASYNLAAIYAQLGQRDKALALLKRHFFQYERYEAVRSKEMMEARVDAVFASLMKDPGFIALTSGADGRLPLPQDRGMKPGAGASQ